ncbi:MAG TPA: hypothetical protein GX506_02095 [Firmicutes bacterium]|nr:hypothetical protein [Bacillota bacterium]
MRQALETIPIWDAFQENTECPLCLLAGQVENSFLTGYLEELVMDSSYRKRVVQDGFCNDHLYKLLSRRDKLGLALTLESILMGILSSDAGTLDAVLPDKVQRLGQPSQCPACEHIASFVRQYCQLIVRMYRDEKEFRDAFARSKGFCIPHTLAFAQNVKEGPRAGSNKEAVAHAFELLRTNLERLSGELRWFIKKHDYRLADAPWNGTEDSVARAIQKLVGLRGMRF